MIIKAPNKQYSGISAGVTFVNGVGETSEPHLISWFKSRGYEVEGPEEAVHSPLDDLSVEDLVAYAAEKGIDIGKSTSKNGILNKIKAAEPDPE